MFRFLPLFRFPCSLFTCSFHLLDRKRLLPPISSLRWAFLINSDCFGVGSEFGKDSCRPFEFYMGPPNISFWSPSLLSFIAVIRFLFSLSAPPFPSFVSEVYFIINVIHISKFFLVPLFVFCLLSLIYNINWLSCLLFSSHPPMASSQLSYSQFMPILIRCLSPLFLILVLCCV